MPWTSVRESTFYPAFGPDPTVMKQGLATSGAAERI